MEHRPKKRLGHGGDAICLKHYSIRTKKSSVTWMKPYIFFHTTRHPNGMASATIEALSTHLARQQKGGCVPRKSRAQRLAALVSRSAQNAARSLIDAIRS